MLDALIKTAKTAFPSLVRVTLVGYSAVGQTIQRYAGGNTEHDRTPAIKTRYVVGSPGTYMYLDGQLIGDQPASTQVAAPHVTTAARALVVSTVATCGEVKRLAAGSPFIELPTQNGHDTAYFVAPTGGSYGATWVTTSFTWNASSVAFH